MEQIERASAVKKLIAEMAVATSDTFVKNADFAPQPGSRDISHSPVVRKYPDTRSFLTHRMPVYVNRVLAQIDSTSEQCVALISDDSAGQMWHARNSQAPSLLLAAEFEEIRLRVAQLPQQGGAYLSSLPPIADDQGSIAMPQLPLDTATFISGPLTRTVSSILDTMITLV